MHTQLNVEIAYTVLQHEGAQVFRHRHTEKTLKDDKQLPTKCINWALLVTA